MCYFNLSIILRLTRNLKYLFELTRMSNYGPLPSYTLTQEYRWSAGYHLSIYMDNFGPEYLPPKVAVFPPDRHGNGEQVRTDRKLNMGGVGITAKIHQVYIIIVIMTTLRAWLMHQ